MKNNEVKKSSWLERLKYIFLWSSAYFTVITVILLLTQAFQDDTYVAPDKFLLIYPFAIVMALGNLIVRAPLLKLVAKTVIHFLITMCGLYVFLILPSKTSANTLVVLFTFAVIYFIIATPILIVSRAKRKKAEESAPYKPMFSKQR